MIYIGSRDEEIRALITEADEAYDALESLGQDRPDLLEAPDWDFDPVNFDLPTRIKSWDELLDLGGFST